MIINNYNKYSSLHSDFCAGVILIVCWQYLPPFCLRRTYPTVGFLLWLGIVLLLHVLSYHNKILNGKMSLLGFSLYILFLSIIKILLRAWPMHFSPGILCCFFAIFSLECCSFYNFFPHEFVVVTEIFFKQYNGA